MIAFVILRNTAAHVTVVYKTIEMAVGFRYYLLITQFKVFLTSGQFHPLFSIGSLNLLQIVLS